ncbi:sunset domain-containing protein [Rhizobium sp. RAF56]|jgi:hypothetical protein|uniref:sunset domain-containing protein n=1 Tax=Rhizobium sp. RAF56 TaxID=3233062 RepID=UPI003F97C494
MRNPRQYWKPKKKKHPIVALAKAAPGAFVSVALVGAAGFHIAGSLANSVTATAQGCDIKGNISIDSGERIYHVPGQEHYAVTKISPEYGERWFCTEEEARTAGWRKARN